MGAVQKALEESIRLRHDLLGNHVAQIEAAAKTICDALVRDHCIYLMGNGGSAADAQHLAAELVGRFMRNRAPVPALALTTDTSVLTAVGNDFGYDQIFSRQIEAFVKEGDVVIGISTSGNSENVLGGIAAARKRGAATLGMTGREGGKLKPLVDQCICIDSLESARIQECHITIGHIVCEIAEETLFGNE